MPHLLHVRAMQPIHSIRFIDSCNAHGF